MTEIEQLRVNPLYENKLDMHGFARMLESPTQSYKFYWLEAILTLLPEKDEMTFEEIVFEMFWEAWYTVSQYHLHLGPTIEGKNENWIEHAVHVVEQDPDVKLPMQRDLFMELLKKNRVQIRPDVNELIKNVPYRLLSSFMPEFGGNDRIWDQKKRLIAYLELLNGEKYLPYIIVDGKAAQRKIRINAAWKQVMLDNYSIVKSWIRMKKVKFLQRRNPGVPGIIYKLEDEQNKSRKLEKVRDLWLTYQEIKGTYLIDLYSGEPIKNSKLSIDHFVPWSYVTSDELWDLIPADRDINSSKGNKLPKWDQFFAPFAGMQFDLYTAIFLSDRLRSKFERCRDDNLNALWASEQLYVPGNSKDKFTNMLEHNLKPIYENALLQGYREWDVE